jgi:hypothetical protein
MTTSTSPALAALTPALLKVERLRKTANVGLWLPPPIVVGSTLALLLTSRQWFHDRFLALFLALIFIIFVAGQILAWVQIRRIRGSIQSARDTLQVLIDAGEEPDLEVLSRRLRREVPEGHLRDLILSWVDLGLQGRAEGYETLLEDALDRRALEDNRILSLHSVINRTTLKLGFLGTLIGIVLTFPPMKRAVLGLSGSDGELMFIRDIALAIDGDQYAILSTLIATGISILVESVTLQILERILAGFDLVQSHVNDWEATVLQPVIRKQAEEHARASELEKTQGRMELALIHAQQTLEAHLVELTEAMRIAGAQLDQVVRTQAAVGERLDDLAHYDKLARAMTQSQQELERHLTGMADALHTASTQLAEVTHVQSMVGKRVTELSEYERQYRGFVASKQAASLPGGARGEK